MSRAGPRILLIGGTYRALCVLERLIERGDRVVAFIGQEGGGERDFCPEILELCDRYSIPARSGRKLGEEIVRWLEDRIRPDLALAVGLSTEIPLSVGGNCRLGLIEVVDAFGADACEGVVLRQRGHELLASSLDHPLDDDDDASEVYLAMVDQLVALIDRYLDELRVGAVRPRARVSFEPPALEGALEGELASRPEPGHETDALERELGDWLGADATLALRSPRDAFSLLLSGLELRPGDQVLVPGLCSSAAIEAVRAAGASPVLVDVDPHTLTIDPDRADELVTEDTRALIVSHAFGQPAALRELYPLAERYGLELVEDAGRSLGARYGESLIGRSPCSAVFQLPLGVPLPADAAALVTLSPALAERLCAKAGPLRLGEGAAALARRELAHLEDVLSTRRQLASTYSAELSPYDAFVVPRTPAERLPVYPSYLLRVTHLARTSADDLYKLLLECGIETRRVELPLEERELAELPIAEDVVTHALLLPLHAALSADQQQIVLDTIFDFAIG